MHQECSERLRFVRKVIEALDAFYALGDTESTAPTIEHMLARDKLTNATVALDEHLAKHGCMREKISNPST